AICGLTRSSGLSDPCDGALIASVVRRCSVHHTRDPGEGVGAECAGWSHAQTGRVREGQLRAVLLPCEPALRARAERTVRHLPPQRRAAAPTAAAAVRL